MNDFCPHDVLRTEPRMGDAASLDVVSNFLDEFDDLEALWSNLDERDFHHLGFRLPDSRGRPVNSLGKAILVSSYAEFSDNNQPTELNLSYDKEALEPGTFAMPAVTSVIDGEEYGELPERDKDLKVPVSTLPDLYGIGLARQYFDPRLEFDEESSLHIEIDRIIGIGRRLQEKYDFDDARYEFFLSQGESIKDIAQEQYLNTVVDEAIEKAKDEYESE